jgi:hypothetical protein
MTCLPDVNVWIALAAERHIHHRAARHWFNNLGDEKLVFCRMAEPNALHEVWAFFIESRLTSPNLWTDAYLCAFTLVTFDTKIPAWKGVSCLVLGGSLLKPSAASGVAQCGKPQTETRAESRRCGSGDPLQAWTPAPQESSRRAKISTYSSADDHCWSSAHRARSTTGHEKRWPAPRRIYC